MIFKVRRVSDWSFKEEDVEINTLDELKALQEKYATPDEESHWENPPIIIDFNDNTIRIYDYYME